jgi:hypothetical protein
VTGRDEAILSAERTLATRFPEDYAAWLRTNEGLERDLGGSYLSLYAVEELVERNLGYAIAELMSGLILIGTDGGGEGIGLDVRGDGNSVVLVNFNSLRRRRSTKPRPSRSFWKSVFAVNRSVGMRRDERALRGSSGRFRAATALAPRPSRPDRNADPSQVSGSVTVADEPLAYQPDVVGFITVLLMARRLPCASVRIRMWIGSRKCGLDGGRP